MISSGAAGLSGPIRLYRPWIIWIPRGKINSQVCRIFGDQDLDIFYLDCDYGGNSGLVMPRQLQTYHKSYGWKPLGE